MAIPKFIAAVVRARSVTPRMRRVTVGGPGLAGFSSCGLGDERIKLLLPPEGERRPALPELDERGFRYPRGVPKPISRTLTVRRFDPEAGELDIDIALHDGPAADWSRHARPGEEVGIMGPTGGYEPSDRMLIAGDEAALPAIATITERLAPDARADVLVEVADANARLALESPADLDVRWLRRDGPAGARLVGAVAAYDWPREPVQVWAAGEALAMRAIRRHVRDELRLPRERYQVVGYWRDRLSEDQAIETHLAAQQAARDAGGSEAEIEDAGLY
jgi:NADPH-dependent ferric siderophore reductase